MIIKHPRLINKQHGTIKNYRYVGDISVRNLRIMLIAAHKNHVFDAPLGDRPVAGADANIMNI